MSNTNKKKYFVFLILAIVFLGLTVYLIWGRGQNSLYDFVAVQKGSVTQEVSVTGRVRPAEDVDLAFEKSGKVAGVYAKVGDKVSRGQLLIQLSNADALAQLESAQANLKAQQAKLDELKKGSRPEQIQIYELKLDSAKVSLNDAKQDLIDKLQDAYTKSDDAVRNKVDQFFTNPRSSDPKLSFVISDTQLKSDIEWERFLLEQKFDFWKQTVSGLSLASDFSVIVSAAKNNLAQVKSFLDNTSLAVNSLLASASLSQTIIDGWKSAVSTARTNVNTAIVNLTAADEGRRTAESALLLAEQDLALEKAGSTAEQIAAQEAQVEKAQADTRGYEAQLAKTIIRSPISGVVTKQEAKEGEIVAANASLVSVISESNFEIEANVAEIDAAKIKVGDKARVTLDAYGEDVVFEAIAIKVDPAETVLEGVATYKTTFAFSQTDTRIKSGMTANLDIATDKKDDVLIVPQRAVIASDGDKFLRVINAAGGFDMILVKTGLRGSDGNIEILEGVKEGDRVVTYIKGS